MPSTFSSSEALALALLDVDLLVRTGRAAEARKKMPPLRAALGRLEELELRLEGRLVEARLLLAAGDRDGARLEAAAAQRGAEAAGLARTGIEARLMVLECGGADAARGARALAEECRGRGLLLYATRAERLLRRP
jgi:hypothetical protein